MTRDEAISRVAAAIPAVLDDAGIAASDTPGNMKEPVDAALLSLGLNPLTDAGSDDPVGFVALVKYHALLAAEGRVADRFDLTVAGSSYRLQQVVATIQTMIERSEKELTLLFGSPAPRGPHVLDLGFLTP